MSVQERLRETAKSMPPCDIRNEAANELDRLEELIDDQCSSEYISDRLKDIERLESNCAKAKARVVELSAQIADVASFEGSAQRKTIEQQAETIRVLTAALQEIAKQKLSYQLEPGEGDFETGYDCCVKVARKALAEKGDEFPYRRAVPETKTGKIINRVKEGIRADQEQGDD